MLQEGSRDERPPDADAIVVLGAAHYGGHPSPIFEARLRHAVDLYRAGAAPYLVVTGGQAAGDTIAEADVARAYALARGVPEAAVLSEAEGQDTLGSLRSVAALFAERDLQRGIFVSDRSHMLRVLRMAGDLGIESHPSPTPLSPLESDLSARIDAVIHEVAAIWLYLVLRA
ncbi:MAG: YdcF family protein [Chloroflexi bacterium]|nr:YdcF family protein [Chloroflexota bacterium]HEV8053950.1 YdcF family protein [Candidatus Limnocylindrales bacterium]